MDRGLSPPTDRATPASKALSLAPRLAVHGAAALAVLALLAAAAQPVMTDDVWWHLAMGEIHARQGPWLADDPLLHTSVSPAAPAAWLADVALHGASRVAGIQGLRVVHAGLVAAIVALAWTWLRRVSGSAGIASVGTTAFVVLSTYRLVQLRPHLGSIVLVLVLLHLVVASRDAPSWRRAAIAVAACALWANVHAAFVLGPGLLLAAALGAGAEALVAPHGSEERRRAARRRALRLAAIALLALAATLANPSGPDQWLRYFTAGEASPALEIVRDEWAPLGLLTWPPANLPPSVVAWLVAWALVVATPAAIAAEARARLGQPNAETRPGPDPALAAMAVASLVLMAMAVRFLWLGIVPIGALAQWTALRLPDTHACRTRARVAVAAGTLLLVAASFRVGDWPMVSQGVAPRLYARAYPAIKYHAHAVWLLADAGLEGRLANSYFMGNFLGYWLAPRMQAFVNGSLNVPPEVMDDHHALMARRGDGAGASFTDLLDRHGVDVFVGEGLPVRGRRNRPTEYTTSHLAATPGWIPIFRNVHAALYARVPAGDDPRADARRDANLDRVARWYASEGVPFDRERGFVVADVVREAPGWAQAHAVVPTRFAGLQRLARSPDPLVRHAAQDELASLLLLVGEVDRAVPLLEQVARSGPDRVGAQRRLVWALLHAERLEEASEAALALRDMAPESDGLSARIADVALEAHTLDPDERRARVATLPAFTRAEMRGVFHGFVEPEARPLRRDRFGAGAPADAAGALEPGPRATYSVSSSAGRSTKPAAVGASVSSVRGGSFSK